jgi:hypothetical protein
MATKKDDDAGTSGGKDKAAEAAAQVHKQGFIGEVPDEIENDAYTVSGQGPETAQREREQGVALKIKALQDHADEGK